MSADPRIAALEAAIVDVRRGARLSDDEVRGLTNVNDYDLVAETFRRFPLIIRLHTELVLQTRRGE